MILGESGYKDSMNKENDRLIDRLITRVPIHSPLLGFEPGTCNGSQYEADGRPMCNCVSVQLKRHMGGRA